MSKLGFVGSSLSLCWRRAWSISATGCNRPEASHGASLIPRKVPCVNRRCWKLEGEGWLAEGKLRWANSWFWMLERECWLVGGKIRWANSWCWMLEGQWWLVEGEWCWANRWCWIVVGECWLVEWKSAVDGYGRVTLIKWHTAIQCSNNIIQERTRISKCFTSFSRKCDNTEMKNDKNMQHGSSNALKFSAIEIKNIIYSPLK